MTDGFQDVQCAFEVEKVATDLQCSFEIDDSLRLICDGTDLTEKFEFITITEKLNMITNFEITFFDLEAADKTKIGPNKYVKLYFGHIKVFEGRIDRPKFVSDDMATVKGYGLEILLIDDETDREEYENTAANSVLTTMIGSTINIGTNDITDLIDIYFDYINKLKATANIAAAGDGDWWVDTDGSGNPQVNVSSFRGSVSSVYTYDTEDNLNIAEREPDSQHLYNYVRVVGYGDGVNQIEAIAQDATSQSTYGLRKKTIVRRDIRDSTALQNIANITLAKHKDPIDRIKGFSDDTRTTHSIGDTVTVIDAGSNLNADYRLVKRIRTFSVGDEIEELEFANLNLDFLQEIDKIKKDLDDLGTYMQGSTNQSQVSNAENCDSSHPLKLRIFLSSRIITLNHVDLSFLIENYRAYSTGASGGGAHNHSVTAKTTQSESTHHHTISLFRNTGVEAITDSTTYIVDDNEGGSTNYGNIVCYTGTGDGILYQNSGQTKDIETDDNPEAHDHILSAFTTESVGTHTHGIVYGIFENTVSSPSVEVKIYNTSHPTGTTIGTYTSDQTELNVTSYFDIGEFNTLEFIPNQNMRIDAAAVSTFFIKSK